MILKGTSQPKLFCDSVVSSKPFSIIGIFDQGSLLKGYQLKVGCDFDFGAIVLKFEFLRIWE